MKIEKFEVWRMFDKISPTYDQINRILSLGLDQKWRRKVAEFLPEKKDLKILDLATGTGDQILAILKKKRAHVIGIDMAEEMLKEARKKLPQNTFIKANAEELPFQNEEFDAATFSFGIRNVDHPSRSLKEIFRVLKPKGKCLILEFSLPPKKWVRPFYLFYLRHILPYLGGFLSKNRSAYRYLNQTIETFPSGKAFCHLLEKEGFQNIKTVPMAFGGVSLYIGEKA